jgi:uncharacterized protein
VQIRVHAAVGEVIDASGAAVWDTVAGGGTPFTRHAWLDALEQSGCAAEASGWRARHVTVWDGARLVGAAPAYIKEDSDGDFSRDWGWAESAERAGLSYYPKLVVGVPFTPASGARLLVAPDAPRAVVIARLVGGLRAIAIEEGAQSLHVLFPTDEEARELEALGLARRVAFQYHWRNRGYASPDDFLARFDSKKRNQARRERAEPARQGITIRTVRGAELAADRARWGRAAHELHRSTVDKLFWGRRWLNADFYRRLFEVMPDAMPDALEVVAAERDGRLVAGAFNVATPTHLYGRYWGCFEEHRFLHFNLCLYHSIDDCISRGVQVFEGGAGGEHKIARGFEPAETYSAHQFFDERLDRAVRDYLAREVAERERALARWRAASPILRR